LQFDNQMLTFHHKAAGGVAKFFLLELADLV
jgi:hypothetical protein